MNKSGPIIIIEDDPDDQYILGEAFLRMNCKNEIIFFQDGIHAFEYLISSDSQPFLIISDINMPKLSGLQLREKIQAHERLKLKCIPYVFFTTSTSQTDILHAYSNCAQGFFVKPNDVTELESTIKKIVEYWKECLSPDYE